MTAILQRCVSAQERRKVSLGSSYSLGAPREARVKCDKNTLSQNKGFMWPYFQVTSMSISEGHQARTQQPEGGELAGLLRIMLS